MKKLFVAAFLLLTVSAVQAQDVYNYIYDKANSALNNANSSDAVNQLNYFYVTELNYMKQKAFQTQKEVTTTFLDTQALNMKEFVEYYISMSSKARKISEKTGKTMISMFIKASLENPLFNDKDEELVSAFANDKEYGLIPFSLDTDWEKALKYAQSQADLILKN